MGKWDVDFDDYEERDGSSYDGDPPKPGIYDAKLVEFDEHDGSADTSMKFIFEITEEPYEGWRGWVYSDLANAKWKTQMIVKAIQGGDQKKMRLDPANKATIVKKAKPVRVRVRKDTYEGEYRPKISVVLPAKGNESSKSKNDDPWDDNDDD